MRLAADKDPLSPAGSASPVAKSSQSQQELLQQLALRVCSLTSAELLHAVPALETAMQEGSGSMVTQCNRHLHIEELCRAVLQAEF